MGVSDEAFLGWLLSAMRVEDVWLLWRYRGRGCVADSCVNVCGFTVAVVFQIELCFQRLIDRFDDPAERFQESLLRVGSCSRTWSMAGSG